MNTEDKADNSSNAPPEREFPQKVYHMDKREWVDLRPWMRDSPYILTPQGSEEDWFNLTLACASEEEKGELIKQKNRGAAHPEVKEQKEQKGVNFEKRVENSLQETKTAATTDTSYQVIRTDGEIVIRKKNGGSTPK